MSTVRQKKRSYTDEDRRQAVVLYQVLGNMVRVADQLGMPERTLTDWKNTSDWWEEIATDVRQETTDLIKAGTDEIISLALEQTKDRLRHGDFVMSKDGNMVRKPMSGRDTAIVAAVFFDKRQILNNQPTSIATNQADGRIQAIIDKCSELGAALQLRTIEGEVVEDDKKASYLSADSRDG